MGKVKYAFVFFTLLYLGACHKYATNYKLVSGPLPQTRQEPLQVPLAGPVYIEPCCKGPYCWKFTPLFSYDISGLVFGVSHKFSSRFDDVMAADVGMVWGENSAREYYKQVSFRVMLNYSEVFWRDGVKFNTQEFSNTHVVTCDSGAFRAARSIKPGDQVRLRGWLVKAEISEKPGETDPYKIITLLSSTSRKDKGEGACEVLYIKSAEDVEILKPGPRLWLWLKWLGLAGMLACAAAWVFGWRKQMAREMAEAKAADF